MIQQLERGQADAEKAKFKKPSYRHSDEEYDDEDDHY